MPSEVLERKEKKEKKEKEICEKPYAQCVEQCSAHRAKTLFIQNLNT